MLAIGNRRCLADDLEVVLESDEVGKAPAHDLVVVEEEHPYRHAPSVALAQSSSTRLGEVSFLPATSSAWM